MHKRINKGSSDRLKRYVCSVKLNNEVTGNSVMCVWISKMSGVKIGNIKGRYENDILLRKSVLKIK